MAASAAPFVLIMVGSAVEAIIQLMGGPGHVSPYGMTVGIEACAVGGALGLIPGLAVGAALALAQPPAGAPQYAPTPSRPGRAACVAGTVYFVENLVVTVASGESFWILICLFGTPVAAAIAAALAKRIQG
ncbi:hypothetical protein ACEZDB_33240 [Streptacidiphilus sp. N1-3]|uniref:Uncharacterized protein n=1 Tax=Streptacidiphilus alkalitolerans TaxID=3342712 RepID=A0ABV6XC09_9ACTN